MTPTEVRLRLFRAGFQPLPVRGKNPDCNGKGWQQKRLTTNPEEIALWEKVFPDALNTGVLCCHTPCLDIDIREPRAAQAAEELVGERFDGHYVLSRIGQWPKRAIPFQTAVPFAKINRPLIAADGSEHKIEFLADGQQIVVNGVHPDSHEPYRWHGGELGAIAHDDLPGIDAAAAHKLVDDIVDLLEREYGYRRKGERSKAKTGNAADHTDWPGLDDLIDHDRLAGFAMRLLRSGMGDGAVVNFLRAAVGPAGR